VHVDRAVDVLPCGVVGHLALPGPPLLGVFLDRLLAQFKAGRRHGRRRGLLLRVQLREACDRVVLGFVTGLLALLAQRVPETDRVRVRASGGLGAPAVLEEGTHATGELSGHVTHHPFQPKNLLRRRTVDLRSASRDASGTHADRLLT